MGGCWWQCVKLCDGELLGAVWQLVREKGRVRLRNMGPLAWDSLVMTALLLAVIPLVLVPANS